MHVTRSAVLRVSYAHLRENTDEAQSLLGDLLISVTSFFRDAEPFKTLRTEAFPHLFAKSRLRRIDPRLGCGCATGEGSLFDRYAAYGGGRTARNRARRFSFSAPTGCRALTVGREGLFSAAIEADVGEERFRRLFFREGKDIGFARNYATWFCSPVTTSSRIPRLFAARPHLLQECSDLSRPRAAGTSFRTFNYAVRPGRILMLGLRDAADSPPGLFRIVDRNARVLQLFDGDKSRPCRAPAAWSRSEFITPSLPADGPPLGGPDDAASSRDRASAPPSILVDNPTACLICPRMPGAIFVPPAGPLTATLSIWCGRNSASSCVPRCTASFEQNQPTLSLPIRCASTASRHRVASLGQAACGKKSKGIACGHVFIEGRGGPKPTVARGP